MTELSDKKIHAGWEQTFSTNNPFCPCDLKSFTKAVRWAERALATPAPAQPDAAEIWALAQVLPGEGMEDAIERIEVRLRAAPAQPDPLHVANERREAEDAKDAARYRWLRDRLPWTLMSAHGYTRMAARLPVSIKADMDEAHEMDAALDAAMASGLSAIAQALAAAPKEKP